MGYPAATQPIPISVVAQLVAQLPLGAQLQLEVVSDSMRPLLRAGDSVLVERVGPTAVQVGDIIVVHDPATLAQPQTHRLLARSATHLYTRGDACVQSDLPLATAALLGRVQAILRPSHAPFAEPRWLRRAQLALSRLDAAALRLGVVSAGVRGLTQQVRRGLIRLAGWQARSHR